MNESFQEFCKRILPVVHAGAEGKKIEHYSAKQWGWGAGRIYAFCTENEYRIAEPKATPLPITPEMWAVIDEKYQWAYLQHGYVILTVYKPEKSNAGFFYPVGDINDFCECPLSICTTGVISALSLTKRPEPVKDYPEPPEFTVNVDRLNTAAEMLKELDEQHERDKKSELDECKRQATHYMHDKYSGRLLYRKHRGMWYVLHEISVLWLAVLITDESKLIEIK